jgi:hypothetical protein
MFDGATVTPVGKFDTVTVATPDPAGAVSRRDAFWLAAPAVTLMLAGVTVSVGTAPLLLLAAPLPPQQRRLQAARALATSNSKRRILASGLIVKNIRPPEEGLPAVIVPPVSLPSRQVLSHARGSGRDRSRQYLNRDLEVTTVFLHLSQRQRTPSLAQEAAEELCQERNRGCPISRTFFVRDVGAMYRVQIATGYLAMFSEGYGLQPVRNG